MEDNNNFLVKCCSSFDDDDDDENGSSPSHQCVNIAARPKLCCLHSNTFFRPLEGGKCEKYMATLHISYTQVDQMDGWNGSEGIYGKIVRTICLPFPPFDLECFVSCGENDDDHDNEEDDDDTFYLIVIEHPKSGKSYRVSSYDLHVVDIVIRNMKSVFIRPVDYKEHMIKSHRERKGPRVLSFPRTVNICAKAFPLGERCILNEECARTNVAVEQSVNINQGIVFVFFTLCSLVSLFSSFSLFSL